MIYFILSILLTVLIHKSWFLNFKLLTYSDWYYTPVAALKNYFALPSLWTSQGTGSVDVSLSFYIFNFFSGLLSHLHF
jgi:hypothetical protein